MPLSLISLFYTSGTENDEWEDGYIESDAVWSDWKPSEEVSTGYPKIRFDEIKGIKGGREYTERSWGLKTQTGYFGKNTKASDNLKQPQVVYQFRFNSETEKLSLEELELTQAFVIQNATESPISFVYKWHKDDEWEEVYIEPDAVWPDRKPSEEVSTGYPKIRFDEIKGGKKYPKEGESLETEKGYFGKDTKLNPSHLNPRGYHFKSDSETKKITLREGLPVSDRRSADSFLIVVLIIEVVVIVVVAVAEIFFPKRHIFSIENNTESTVDYHVKWTKKADWSQDSIEPGATLIHQMTGILFLKRKPQIRFDDIVNDKKETRGYKLETKARRFGRNTDVKISREYAYKYHFGYDSKTKKTRSLQFRKKALMPSGRCRQLGRIV